MGADTQVSKSLQDGSVRSGREPGARCQHFIKAGRNWRLLLMNAKVVLSADCKDIPQEKNRT
jgi:hypothetical protein